MRSERLSANTFWNKKGDPMITLELRIEYNDERTAKAVFDSISPDNEGYVSTELMGNKLLMKISSESAGTLRNTADDLMACIKAAEEASGLVSGSAPDLDGDTLFE
jgi:tRNA threonylcarbamoyladenosine modification (KEOPS) complex  Pcc1 subunit